MTDLQAIQQRISRRSFTGPLAEEDRIYFSQLAQQLAGQLGVGIRLVENDPALFGGFLASYGMFKGVASFFVLSGDENDIHMMEKVGYGGEKLVLEATKKGLGTCWVGGTFNRAALQEMLEPGKKLAAVIPVGPVPGPQKGKEKLVYQLAHLGKAPKVAYYADGTPPEWFLAGVAAADKAPSALNRKPVRFAWQDATARALVPETRPAELIDLGIAKLHFELGAQGSFALGNNAPFSKE